MSDSIKPTAGKKRGRILRTDTGKEISHEEVVCGLIKRTAVELAESKMCACGSPIPKPTKGRYPIRCDVCDIENRLAYHKNRNRKINPNIKERGKYAKNNTVQNKVAVMQRWKESHRAYVARKKAERKAAGLCQFCGKHPTPVSRCDECKAKRKAYETKKRQKKETES